MARMLSVNTRLGKDTTGKKDLKFTLLHSSLSWHLLGFLLSRGTVFAEMWPFGVAYFAALKSAGMNRKTIFFTYAIVLAGTITALGFFPALPYLAAVTLLLILPRLTKNKFRLLLIAAWFLIKVPLHYLLKPVPIVFIIGLTECTLAVFSYNLLEFAIKKCVKKQLACDQFKMILLASACIIGFNLHWGGFSIRLFLIAMLLVLGVKAGGLAVSCVLAPAIGLLAFLLGEPSQLVFLIIVVGLLKGVMNRFWWGYYLSPLLAGVFVFPGTATAESMQWLLVLLIASGVGSLVPRSAIELLAYLIPGTEPHQRRKEGHSLHLKQVLDNKIDQYLEVFQELEEILQGVENPLFHKQMQGMAELLSTMKGSFAPHIQFTKDFEAKILNKFAADNLEHITVLKNGDGYEVHGMFREKCQSGLFCHNVAKFCSGTLESQRYGVTNYNCFTNGTCGFTISPWPRYRVEIGRAKIARGEISGDSQVTFEITCSKVAIVLSDGMGIGLKAHKESNMAIRLLKCMLTAGYDLTTAVWQINRLLLLRNQEEMFVTIDLVVVDLFTGQLEFVKIGSAPSFIKRGHEVEIIHNHNLPIGVLSQVEIETDQRTLKEGEVLIMATDGVLDAQRGIVNKDEWMCWNLRRLQEPGDMAHAAEKILSASLEYTNGVVHDDMMVVAARLVPNEEGISPYRRI